jgi:hypothetical protein
MRPKPLWERREIPHWLTGELESMGLYVGLVNHIQSSRVTDLQPAVMVGVVGQSHRIKIELFHQ